MGSVVSMTDYKHSWPPYAGDNIYRGDPYPVLRILEIFQDEGSGGAITILVQGRHWRSPSYELDEKWWAAWQPIITIVEDSDHWIR
jgi:hypothetical protein